ncbi:MAG: sensor domain-containing diguanylate cyclase [Candidatus Omnitrophica bacterium]|nr:sensor domain-containing diguanylate cyclase [Candidatus Omnitrophota bacterium]
MLIQVVYLMENQDNIHKLEHELEKARSQFYIFYELTQAMRTTLRLEEIAYIILTGLTAHHGLGFNRAVLFLVDERKENINGFMGIGPMDTSEANPIWKAIEKNKMDLYSLIQNYHSIKKDPQKPKFIEFVQTLQFPLTAESGIMYETIHEVAPLHIDITSEAGKKYAYDPIVTKLSLKEFVIAPLWSSGNPLGIILVDNCVTQKSITEENRKILAMFINQAAGAIENSKIFENTLFKAHTDSLTNLWNYGYFQYKLDEELMRAKNNGAKISVVMVDIDDFKKFNDAYGHQNGDDALKLLAKLLKENARKIDVIARYGGEEFTLILPHTNREEAVIIAERIRQAVESSEICNSRLTVSIGIASFDEDAKDKEELIRKADIALYRAKREGKNRIILA